MTSQATDFARRAIDSSAVVHLIRPVVETSVVCAAVVSTVHWLRRTRERIVVGLGGKRSAQQTTRDSQQLDALAADSRLIAALSSLWTIPSIAWRESGVKHLLDPILGMDLLNRTRMSGCIIVIAVMTHTVLLAVLGVPVHEVGWAIRGGLVVVCVIVVRWPEPFAAAWRDRTAPFRNGHRA